MGICIAGIIVAVECWEKRRLQDLAMRKVVEVALAVIPVAATAAAAASTAAAAATAAVAAMATELAPGFYYCLLVAAGLQGFAGL